MQENKNIVAARDDLSLAAEGRPLRECNATVLGAFFWEQIFCRYGTVIQVVTDNGPEIAGAFRKLLTQYHIPQNQIFPYNKQAKWNGRKKSFYYLGELDEILPRQTGNLALTCPACLLCQQNIH